MIFFVYKLVISCFPSVNVFNSLLELNVDTFDNCSMQGVYHFIL